MLSTDDALSIKIRFNVIVPLALIFTLKLDFSDFIAAGRIVFHKHILFVTRPFWFLFNISFYFIFGYVYLYLFLFLFGAFVIDQAAL